MAALTLSANMQGAVLMLGSMASFTLNDTFIKLTGGDIPLFQLLFLRGVLTTLLIFGLARALGGFSWRVAPREWRLIALRCAAEIGAAYFFLSALFSMPLANATAILQVLPLAVTMAAALFLGERVGWRRWLAIAIGFGGMLLIVQPGTDGFTSASLYALIAVVCITVRDLAVRRMSAQVPSMLVSVMAAASVMAFSGVASLGQGWAPVSFENGLYIMGSAVLILGGYYFSVAAMRVGDVSYIAPFRYSSLVFALFFGVTVFGQWPEALVLLGAAIVVATGLFSFYREASAR